jgi:hypothetical protein
VAATKKKLQRSGVRVSPGLREFKRRLLADISRSVDKRLVLVNCASEHSSVTTRFRPLDKDEPLLWARNGIIRNFSDLPDRQICCKLDFHLIRRDDEPTLTLPYSWVEQFGVSKFVEAYDNKQLRPRVQKLISVDKKLRRNLP